MASNNANIRSITLGSSTLALSGATGVVNFTNATNLTFNAGTSQINSSSASPGLLGGGQTFYNVSFTSNSAGITTITGANTFNNLTFTSRAADGFRSVIFGANQTVSGTLTFGAANTAVRRYQIQSDVIGTRRTITLNGTLATLADVDFRDIGAAGSVSTPWTGTRLGNGLNNNNITFATPKTVYWNLAGTQNWSATGWATTNNGTPAVNNFPLAQDTAVFTEAGAAGTVTTNVGFWIGNLQMADGVSNRTTAFTLATGAATPVIYGNVTLFSSLTLTGTGIVLFAGQGTTQTITSAGVSLPQPITIDSPFGTVQLLANLISSNTSTGAVNLTAGTIDLNEFNLSVAGRFTSSNTNVRAIDFGSVGKLLLTYAAGGAGITHFLMTDVTNFSYIGTSYIELSGNNTAGTRTFIFGGSASGTEAQAMDFYVSAGTDTVGIGSSTRYKNLNFTGFGGTIEASTNTIYGSVVLSSTMTVGSGGLWSFISNSGTQNITSNGTQLLRALVFGVTGSTNTVRLQDNLTTGTFNSTFTSGTLNLNNCSLTTASFSSANSNTRSIAFGTGNITVTGNSAIVWSTSTATNFSYTGTPTVNSTYAGSTGTRTIVHGATGGATEANSPTINFTAGSDTIATTNGSSYKNLNFTGFTGSLNNGIRTLFGNLTFSSGMTCTAGTNATTFAATSGTQLVTTNGNTTIDFPITQNGVGGTVQLVDSFTIGSTRAYTLTNGTFNANNQNVTVGDFVSSNSNTRTLTMGSGTWTIQDSGTSWNIGTTTGLTLNRGTSTISMTSASDKTFAGGGLTYYKINQGGSGNLTLTGANTFFDMTNTVQPCTITFPASTTTSFSNFSVKGTAGNLVSLRSSTSGTRYTLAKVA